jgi:hypothetical protein
MSGQQPRGGTAEAGDIQQPLAAIKPLTLDRAENIRIIRSPTTNSSQALTHISKLHNIIEKNR